MPDYSIRLTAETTIYQNEVKCRVLENDFNYSQNPTVLINPTYSANAQATITITVANGAGYQVTVIVNDPQLGSTILGIYTTTVADTNVNTLATNLAAVLANNSAGYNISVFQNVITIEARQGVGSLINGGNNLVVVISLTNKIFSQAFDQTYN